MKAPNDLWSNDKYIIDRSKDWHVAWWATRFGVPERAIIEAVDAVGCGARDVSNYLRSRGAQSRAKRCMTWWTWLMRT
jgi:hypothetical protein